MGTGVRVDVGIIGGTGIGERLAKLGGVPLFVPTPSGTLRGRLVQSEGLSLFVVQRHSAGHSTPPHLVNYAAIARGMKQLDVRACLGTAAVGSLHPDWSPGQFVVCSDFLDFTGRHPTLFDRSVVHRDFTTPYSSTVQASLHGAISDAGKSAEDGVYVCTNGPRYETPKEVEVYQTLGGDVIGMTSASEAILLHEAGVDYGCLAIVTNAAAGISTTPLDHREVVEEMERSGELAVRILVGAAKRLVAKS